MKNCVRFGFRVMSFILAVVVSLPSFAKIEAWDEVMAGLDGRSREELKEAAEIIGDGSLLSRSAVELTVLTSPSLTAFYRYAARVYSRQHPHVTINIVEQSAQLAITTLLQAGQEKQGIVWAPSSSAYKLVAQNQGVQFSKQGFSNIVRSLPVLLVWEAAYEELEKRENLPPLFHHSSETAYETFSYSGLFEFQRRSNLFDTHGKPFPEFLIPNPAQNDNSLSALSAYFLEIGMSAMISTNSELRALANFLKRGTFEPSSLHKPIETFIQDHRRNYAGILVSEHEAAVHLAAHPEELRVFYPDILTIDDFPLLILANLNWTQRLEALRFGMFLLGKDSQEWAVQQFGFRPGRPDIGDLWEHYVTNGLEAGLPDASVFTPTPVAECARSLTGSTPDREPLAFAQ